MKNNYNYDKEFYVVYFFQNDLHFIKLGGGLDKDYLNTNLQ